MNHKTTTAQDLNDRLDQVEEFYLPDIIEHQGEPLARVTSVAHQDLHLGAAEVRPLRNISESSEKNLTGLLLDVAIIALFVLTCYVMYNAIVWSIWS
jgi:hypothetical protein